MTTKQLYNYNKMLYALQKIAKGYQTTAQIRKGSEKQYGLDYSEALEMSYENIQLEAKQAAKGIKKL